MGMAASFFHGCLRIDAIFGELFLSQLVGGFDIFIQIAHSFFYFVTGFIKVMPHSSKKDQANP